MKDAIKALERKTIQILLATVLLSSFFVLPALAGVTEVSILPENPTTVDPISFDISGLEGSGPVWINDVDFTLNGSSITLNIFLDSGPFTMMTPWDYTHDVGLLSAGTYDLTVNSYHATSPTSNTTITTSFDVSDIVLSTQSLGVLEGTTATFTVALLSDPHGTVQATAAHKSGDPDITVQSGALLTFDSSNYSIPQIVTLAAAEDGDYFDGQAIIEISAAGYTSSELQAYEADNDIPLIIYVDKDAPGLNTGTSWTNDFTDLK